VEAMDVAVEKMLMFLVGLHLSKWCPNAANFTL